MLPELPTTTIVIYRVSDKEGYCKDEKTVNHGYYYRADEIMAGTVYLL